MMERINKTYVCPAGLSFSLDNRIRKLIHKPLKILGPYIKDGMSVLDLGCGPGYFTLGIAELVGNRGKVTAADLQQGMLDRLSGKIRGTELQKRIELHKCREESIGFSGSVDFVLAFWMIHEVPDKERLFLEINSILIPDGILFISEPKIHVTGESFARMVTLLESTGFKVTDYPKVAISRSVLATKIQQP